MPSGVGDGSGFYISRRQNIAQITGATVERETGVRREQLLRRVRHLTQGVIFGSREFINEWFGRNRGWFGGASREHRKTGARPLGKQWKGLYNLRQLR